MSSLLRGFKLGLNLEDMMNCQRLGVHTIHARLFRLLQKGGLLVGGDARDEWKLKVSRLVQLVYLDGGLRTIEFWHAKVAKNDSV